MIEKIQAWLTRPVYVDGLLLYEAAIGADFQLRMLKMGDDDYNRDKLLAALEARLKQLQEAERAQKAAYPDALKGELVSSGLLMDERTLIKERMRTLYNSGVSESAELKTLAFRILSIKDELDGVYGRKNFYDQHGFLPGDASHVPEADVATDLLRRRNSLRTYVSKYQKATGELYEPKKLKRAQQKLERYQTELHQVDTHLAGLLNHS